MIRIEIVNRNEPGFEHFVLIPTIEIVNELMEEGCERSIGISFMNLSIWLVW